MNRETPHAMPPSIRDDVEMKLGDRELTALDDAGRFVVRRLIADAYAKGVPGQREPVDSGREAN